MATDGEEDTAISALDGADWMGRSMKVNKARPREENGGGGGGGQRRGGGGGGGNWGDKRGSGSYGRY
jgi:hypothetical protein